MVSGRAATTAKARRRTSDTDRCHDITVYSAIGLAAGACSGNGILLDISNPVNPVRIDAVSDPNYAFWHSANFSNDGTKVLFTDEWGGGGQPRCRATDPMNWGADAIFTLSKGKLTLASYYKMPAPQTELENCVAHNGSLIPIPGRDVMVQAWYQGGVSIVDFTDVAHPVEIGYFDRGPVDGDKRAMGGQWSTYWYNGYIYGSEIARGVDVFKLVPNKFITQNEIDACQPSAFRRAQCPEPAEDYLACKFRRGPRLPRPVDPQQRTCASTDCCTKRRDRQSRSLSPRPQRGCPTQGTGDEPG